MRTELQKGLKVGTSIAGFDYTSLTLVSRSQE